MFELITMLLSTLGATGMGSTLKIIAGIFDRIGAAKESKEKREILREMDLRKAMLSFKKQFLEKLITITALLLAVHVALLLLSGCSTFSSSRFSAPSGRVLNSSPSSPEKIKTISPSYSDSLKYLWEQKPLWQLPPVILH